MSDFELILASSSPRRAKLLQNLGLSFRIVKPGKVSEVLEGPAEEVVKRNALTKLRAVLKEVMASGVSDAVVVAADTVVLAPGGKVLGKPSSTGEAREMLNALRCGWHSVLTGVAVGVVKGAEQVAEEVFTVETRVRMRCFSDEELEAYLRSGEPLGKAGAYALQGLGALLVDRVEGDPYNVVGLPLARLHEALMRVAKVNLLELVPRPRPG